MRLAETCVPYLNLELLALILDGLDLRLEPPDLLVDKLQTTIDGHERLCLVLLQQHRADLLVNVRFIVEEVEFLRQGLSARHKCFGSSIAPSSLLCSPAAATRASGVLLRLFQALYYN